jgi:sugar lactone lactonase YvrE
MGFRLGALILILIFLMSLPAYGQASAQPQVETLASGLKHPTGIAVASDGKVYFSEFGVEGRLSVYLPEKQIIEAAISRLVSPAAVALAPNGIVYVAESAGGRLWSYNPETGESKIVAEAIQGIWGVAVSRDGTIYLSIKGIPSQENPEGGKILKFNLEGGNTETLVSGLYVPYGLDVASNGDVYFVELGTLSEVRGTLKVLRAATGQVETLLEGLAWPYDVAAAEDGTVYFTVKAGKIYAFKEAGEPELLAEGFKRLYGVALDPQGENLYFTEFGSPVSRDGGDGTLRRIILKGVPGVTETPTATQTVTTTVTKTITKTVTATVTVTPSLSETVEDLKGVVEALAGSLQTISLMVWVTLAVSMVAVAAAVIALLLTLKFPRAGLKRRRQT